MNNECLLINGDQNSGCQHCGVGPVSCHVWPLPIHMHVTTYPAVGVEQGKSEGFESCDWPIVRKRPIWVKIGDVLSRVTLKFDG